MKRCFVIQGYGQKTDYSTGRVLNLDASYAVIKDAVESAGLACIRCDEIAHSGVIDVPMYQQLLEADLVIADLSTYNVNAAFELGVRYALRPHSTIIVAEDQFKNPFDTSHTVMLSYEHLGKDLGAQEARRFGKALAQQIRALLNAPKTDSPVYTYLPQLSPPGVAAAAAAAPADAAPATTAGDAIERTLKQMLEEAHRLMALRLYKPAGDLLEALRQLRPHDVDVTQRLAEAIYKSEQPDLQTALYAARELLNELHPIYTNDPQTLTLWGALHKRLWEHSGKAAWLDDCVLGYGRGFALKQDHYTGVNLAFVLDVRAEEAAQRGDMANAITDRTLAARARRDVLLWCSDSAERLRDGDPIERYWVVASLWEAALGLGDEEQRQRWEAELATIAVPAEMRATREKQAAKLRELAAQAQLRGLPTGQVKPFAPSTPPAAVAAA
ncbi:MAG TPA: hypothetical protein PLW24_04650 [Burkholderiaceae bacterium]|nr:hypothetical protein [Burkholderiaceae bacterium]